MDLKSSHRGFRYVTHQDYPVGTPCRIVGESSVVLDYEDSLGCPGSSALWIGSDHHLNREEVAEFVGLLQHWLDHKRLPAVTEPDDAE